jgi:glucose/arabinose dehydrogenase/mono/diheme cytochrome c family protein
MTRFVKFLAVLACAAVIVLLISRTQTAWSRARLAPAADSKGCASNDSGLKLPGGFCATVFADDIGHARDMVVAPNGVVYVNTWSGRYYGNSPVHEGGFLVALQDTTGSGKANVIERFGETAKTGGAGGSGIALYKNAIYAEINDRIAKYALASGSIAPKGQGETILSGLPLTGDHPMHPFLIDSKGQMFVDVASPSNACQEKNRIPASPGKNPCDELSTRGGVWLYDANKTDQKFSPAERYATGIRNGEGMAMDAAGNLFVTQHGRDQLHANWPAVYKADQEATLPAEQVMLLKKGADYGWPECYYDPFVDKLILAPEYGGDGKKAGVCAEKTAPIAAYPAHWAPNGMVRYDKKQFPSRYDNGVFVAFHGSWDRAPYPQGGYNVVFQPLSGTRASGQCEIFADDFAGGVKSPDGAKHRPSGLAVGPDGALYVSDDVSGRIYRITYVGGAGAGGGITPCPSAASPAGEIENANAKPPEGVNPDAGKETSGKVAVPPGATAAMVAEGEKIFRGQEGGATCTGCHGADASGTSIGPSLISGKWMWSDGSYAGIAEIITEGVPEPKVYRALMPPMGGATLTPEQVNDIAAFLWSVNQKK